MIEVKKVFDKIEGEILADFIQKNNIPCFLSSDDGGGTRPHLGLTHGYRLIVDEQHVEETRKLINDFDEAKN